MKERQIKEISKEFAPFGLENILKTFLASNKKIRINKKILTVSFMQILSSPKSVSLFKILDKTSFLTFIFPEIDKMKKSNKKYYYHPNGLFEHSFEVYEALEHILNNLKKYFPKNINDIEKHLSDNSIFNNKNYSRSALMKLAAIFHDNAKPETAKKESDKVSFIEHDKIGAKKIKKILSNLYLNSKANAYIKKLILFHMRPSSLTKNNIITKRASDRFFRDIGETVIEQTMLSMADWLSYKRLKIHSLQSLKKQQKKAAKLIEDYYIIQNKKELPKIIDGNIIMKEFNLKPGPWIGELLKLSLDKQIEGKISTKEQSLALICSKLTQIKKKYKLRPRRQNT
jgi:poly(A) polymerase